MAVDFNKGPAGPEALEAARRLRAQARMRDEQEESLVVTDSSVDQTVTQAESRQKSGEQEVSPAVRADPESAPSRRRGGRGDRAPEDRGEAERKADLSKQPAPAERDRPGVEVPEGPKVSELVERAAGLSRKPRQVDRER